MSDPHDNLEEFTDPANYDLEQGPRSQARIAFWRRMAQQFGGPVLELGCGTGLVATAVAAMGPSVTGFEIVSQYGDWDFSRFKAKGERLITPCRSKAGARRLSAASRAARS